MALGGRGRMRKGARDASVFVTVVVKRGAELSGEETRRRRSLLEIEREGGGGGELWFGAFF